MEVDDLNANSGLSHICLICFTLISKKLTAKKQYPRLIMEVGAQQVLLEHITMARKNEGTIWFSTVIVNALNWGAADLAPNPCSLGNMVL